jgi:hypothetical protein
MAMRLGDKGKIALLLALGAAPGAAVSAAQDQPAPPPEMQKLLQSCDAHKFETTIHVTGDGEPHDSQVKVCGKQGQSDADWVAALKDMVDKAAANQEMPQSMKEQVIAALNAEIARLTALLPKEAPLVASLPPPRAAPKDDLAAGYSTLPPLPPPVAQSDNVVEVAPSAVASASASAIAVAPAPRLTLRCITGRDISLAEPCDTIERGNMLVVQADDAGGSGVLLKFFRRGDFRGELQLPAMRPGQPVMVALPSTVCAGVVRTRIEIRAVRAPGSSEAILGPYNLRC